MAGFEEILSSEEEEVEKGGESCVSCCGDDADDEDDLLAEFLESEVLAVDSDQEDMTSVPSKRRRVEENSKNSPGMTLQKCFHAASDGNQVHSESEIITKLRPTFQSQAEGCGNNQGPRTQTSIENGVFSKIPIELFQKILKFLSSEDLVTCALVCRFLNSASSDESLWRRLYCMRWGLPSPAKLQGKPRARAWKRLYIERDEEDMIEFVRNTPAEFREYYIQMQSAKRSQAPLPSQNMLVQEGHAPTLKLGIPFYVKKLDGCMYVMIHAEKLFQIHQVNFWFVQSLDAVLIDGSHHQKKNWIPESNHWMLMQQWMKQSLSWGQVALHELIYWVITVTMKRNLKQRWLFVDWILDHHFPHYDIPLYCKTRAYYWVIIVMMRRNLKQRWLFVDWILGHHLPHLTLKLYCKTSKFSNLHHTNCILT